MIIYTVSTFIQVMWDLFDIQILGIHVDRLPRHKKMIQALDRDAIDDDNKQNTLTLWEGRGCGGGDYRMQIK